MDVLIRAYTLMCAKLTLKYFAATPLVEMLLLGAVIALGLLLLQHPIFYSVYVTTFWSDL